MDILEHVTSLCLLMEQQGDTTRRIELPSSLYDLLETSLGQMVHYSCDNDYDGPNDEESDNTSTIILTVAGHHYFITDRDDGAPFVGADTSLFNIDATSYQMWCQNPSESTTLSMEKMSSMFKELYSTEMAKHILDSVTYGSSAIKAYVHGNFDTVQTPDALANTQSIKKEQDDHAEHLRQHAKAKADYAKAQAEHATAVSGSWAGIPISVDPNVPATGAGYILSQPIKPRRGFSFGGGIALRDYDRVEEQKPKCECGSASVGGLSHSHWCVMFKESK